MDPSCISSFQCESRRRLGSIFGDLETKMKVLYGVLLSVCLASAAVYQADLQRFLGDLPVTKFDFPEFAERNYTSEEFQDCSKRLGQFVDGEFVGNRSDYKMLDILKSLGGAPGEVEAPRRNGVLESAMADPEKRPLEDAPEDKWFYDYRATDYQYYYRLEHAVKRFDGTDKTFLDIVGQLAWTPKDTCGRIKVADYRQDDTGFSFNVTTDYCFFQSNKYLSCATIPYCNTRENGDIVCVG